MTALKQVKAFGLIIESEIDLPELPFVPTRIESDVHIKLSPIGLGITTPTGKGALWKTAPNLFELHVPHVARFLVRNGRDILVEPEAEATPSELRTYLLGSAFGALLQQRGFLVLHSGGFVHRAHAILICGRSGAGKSTILQGMARRGYPSMSDDLIPISLDENGRAIALSGYPHTRLCHDAAAFFKLDENSPSFLTTTGQKVVVGMSDFDPTPRPISAVFCVETHNLPELELLREPSLESTRRLITLSYRKKFLRGMSLRPRQFEIAAMVAHQVPVFSIRRDTTLNALEGLLDRIESEIRNRSEI